MKIRSMLCRIGAMVIVALAVACASAESAPSVSELIDNYSQALDSTASFIDHYERSGEYRGHYPSDHPFYATYGGKKFLYKTFKRGIHKFKENTGEYHQEYAWGYFNEEFKNLPEDSPMSRLWITTKEFSYFHQNKGHQQLGSANRRKNTIQTIEPPKASVGIAHILGYVDTNERLDEVLRKANHVSVRRRTEKVGDIECFRIEANTKYGRFAIWIDPEHGYHAARVRHKSKEGEYLHHHIIPKGSIATGYLDVLEFKQVDNTWVPVEVKAGFHRTIGSPAYYMDEDKHYKRTKIILNPDHDELGSFDDPLENSSNDPELKNGTRIRLNNEQEEYIWQDGKVIDADGKIIMDCTKKDKTK